MNFITFPVDGTNIFPASNSTAGGQLLTEWNIRCRDTVATDPDITYEVGPSYVHSSRDYEVSILSDSDISTSSSTLRISEGKAIINGHYVETLVPMTVDLIEANTKLASQSRELLKGNLAIGIRTFYATEATVAGTILIENADNMYLGFQLVVLPEDQLILPSESPDDRSKVTADIRLATFKFVNNKIEGLINNEDKTQYIDFSRVKNIEEFASSKYITKTGLNSKKLYAFAGKGTDPSTGLDTWEDVTDSMVVWDANPSRTLNEPRLTEAQFVSSDSGVYLAVPHKQVYGMTADDGVTPEYYAPKVIGIPSASFATNKPGVVTREYTQYIRDIATKVNMMRISEQGSQVYYMDVRTVNTDLPPINPNWIPGDYCLVKNDDYFAGGSNSSASSPATKYIVLPGYVLSITFVGSYDGTVTDPATFPSRLKGVELGYLEWYESAGQSRPDTSHPDYYPQFWTDGDAPRGVPIHSNNWYDYFRLRYYAENSSGTYPYTDYYFVVATSSSMEWSDAVLVTGSIDLATENTIGGFYNASEEAVDYGYVMLDDSGHLRLIDYDLLRSGTLAYQLGDDITSIPDGIAIEDTQNYISEYVNRRIAFRSDETTSSYPPVIHVILPLSASNEGGTIEINGIDSRFDTAVCLHIQGDAGNNVTVNIRDCQKFMIDPTIEGEPVINVYRTCLRYDASVFNYIKSCIRSESIYGSSFTGFQDVTLWYQQLASTDPNLCVDGMTVTELNAQIIPTDINYWRELGTAANDNEFMVALKSITFSGKGEVIGISILAANNSTDNVSVGEKIVVGDINLPQGLSLTYPPACLTKSLKVTGDFTSAYKSYNSWYMIDTSMTLLTSPYDETNDPSSIKGQVAFHSVTTLVPSTIEQTSIAAWESDSYNILTGGAIN